MDYSKLSDDDLSIEVVRVKFGFSCYLQNGRVRALNPDGDDFYFDINNPSDAWPIILENKITVDPTGEAWQHKPHPQDYYYHEGICNNVSDKNPLRAAMIVYLMIQEVK